MLGPLVILSAVLFLSSNDVNRGRVRNANKTVNILTKLEWNNFKKQHAKHYNNEIQEIFRMGVWLDSQQKVFQHNKNYAQGLTTFKQGINKYSDLFQYEFVSRLNIYHFNNSTKLTRMSIPSAKKIKDKLDWRQSGAVTPVKDQGEFNASWAFAAAGALESQRFLRVGHLVALSEQNLIDCSLSNKKTDDDFMEKFAYTKKIGINRNKNYPYLGGKNACQHKNNQLSVKVKKFKNLPKGNEDILKKAVAFIGPIAAVIDASHESFQRYESGVYYDSDCNSNNFNHAVLIIGYGTDIVNRKEVDYWLIKNSWGKSWGDNGFGKIARNRNNHCGIASNGFYPVL